MFMKIDVSLFILNGFSHNSNSIYFSVMHKRLIYCYYFIKNKIINDFVPNRDIVKIIID